MLRVQNLQIPLDADERALRKAAARAIGVREKEILRVSVGKKSVDARKKTEFISSSPPTLRWNGKTKPF